MNFHLKSSNCGQLSTALGSSKILRDSRQIFDRFSTDSWQILDRFLIDSRVGVGIWKRRCWKLISIRWSPGCWRPAPPPEGDSSRFGRFLTLIGQWNGNGAGNDAGNGAGPVELRVMESIWAMRRVIIPAGVAAWRVGCLCLFNSLWLRLVLHVWSISAALEYNCPEFQHFHPHFQFFPIFSNFFQFFPILNHF